MKKFVAALSLGLAFAACAAAEGMATFAGAAIDDSYLDDIRGKDCF